MAFEGDSFPPASVVCDTRDGELAIVVSQTGDDVDVRWFSNPLEIRHGKAANFAPVEGRRLACVGFLADSLDNDETHMSKAIAQVSHLLGVLPTEFIDLLRSGLA